MLVETTEDLVKSRANIFPESPHARSLIESDMDQLDRQVQMYDDAVASLQARRDQLSKIRHARKSLLSPIRKLHQDILEVVFDLVFAGHDHDHILLASSGLFTGQIFPLRRVCSFWRQLLSQPVFWSSLRVVVDGSCTPKAHTSLCEYLSHSGNTTPITLDLHVSPTEIPSDREQTDRLLDTLTLYSSRLRSLSLSYWEEGQPEHVFRAPGLNLQVSARFPLLEDLTIYGHEGVSLELTFGSSHVLFPRLQTLRVSSLCLSDNGLDLRNITSLALDSGLKDRSLPDQLRKCPRLCLLYVGSFGFGDEQPSSLLVNHNRLSTIFIDDVESCNSRTAQLEAIRLPSLEALHLRASGLRGFHGLLGVQPGDLASMFGDISIMLSRSQCLLRKVSLDNIPESIVSSFLQNIRLRSDALVVVNEAPYAASSVSVTQ